MDKPKKTEIITFRTSKDIKEDLEMIAEKNKWSISQVVEQLIRNFIIDPHPEEITIRTKELRERCNEFEEDGIEAVKLETMILTEEMEDGRIRIYKALTFEGLECGGLGGVSYDVIECMTDDEIRDIP